MIRPVIDCVLDWIVLIAIDNKKVHKSFISMVDDIVARCCFMDVVSNVSLVNHSHILIQISCDPSLGLPYLIDLSMIYSKVSTYTLLKSSPTMQYKYTILKTEMFEIMLFLLFEFWIPQKVIRYTIINSTIFVLLL